ncbi:hypothetical protein BX600DRAFT_464035 [Xylariales sp. PMI_506]|nr:hypothetical protein BX600DRAFT_464035 [Xylariales sp. PMI_506]
MTMFVRVWLVFVSHPSSPCTRRPAHAVDGSCVSVTSKGSQLTCVWSAACRLRRS